MVSEEQKSRAKKLAAGAQGNIKAKGLLKYGTGILRGLQKKGYLHDKPILEYFSEDEQPHYFCYNGWTGVKIGEIRETPGLIWRNCIWITNRGFHITVGKSSGDFHYFLPFDSVHSVEAKNGVTKNKFILETDEGEVRFPTTPTFDIDSAASFIEQNISVRKETPPKKSKGTYADPKEKERKEYRSARSDKNTGEASLSTLQQMNEYDFEYVIARVWEQQGWETEVTGGTRDRGVDIIAVKSDPVEQRQYIQVKRYNGNNKVGSNEIQKYSGLYARNESVEAVVVVTTSDFTSEARQIATNRNVKLINGSQLIDMIRRYDISQTDISQIRK